MRTLMIVASAVALLGMSAAPASAEHSWGSYHWARSSNPLELQLDDNLTTSAWRSIGLASSADWSKSDIITAGR